MQYQLNVLQTPKPGIFKTTSESILGLFTGEISVEETSFEINQYLGQGDSHIDQHSKLSARGESESVGNECNPSAVDNQNADSNASLNFDSFGGN